MKRQYHILLYLVYIILVVVSAGIYSPPLFGQPISPTVTKVWDKTYGSSSSDFIKDVVIISDNEYLLAGTSPGSISGDKSAINWGASDFWVVKIDSRGNKLWDASFGGTSNEYLQAALPHVDGGFLLFGHSRSGISGNKSAPRLGEVDVWLVKINSSGVKEWDKSVGTSERHPTPSIQQTPDGGYWIGWQTNTGCPPDDEGLNSNFVKIDRNGNVIKRGALCMGIKNLLYTSDGNLLVDGYESELLGPWRMLKVSEDFEIIWETGGDATRGFRGQDLHNSLLEASDGNYLILGTVQWLVPYDFSWSGMIAKINAASGELMDKKFYGSLWDEDPMRIPFLGEQFNSGVIGADGSIIVLGLTNTPIPRMHVTERSRGTDDYWIAGISSFTGDPSGTGLISDGEVIWDKRFGGSSIDEGTKIARINSREYLLAGYSESDISRDKSENRRGWSDFWVIKLRVTWTPTIVITRPEGIPIRPSLICEEFYHDDRLIPCDWEIFTNNLPLPNFNIMPQFVNDQEIGSVQFMINGNLVGIDNEAPFLLFEPKLIDENINKPSLELGTYELQINAFSESDAKGKIIESFRGNLSIK